MPAVFTLNEACITGLSGRIEDPVIDRRYHTAFINLLIKSAIGIGSGIITVGVGKLCEAVLCSIAVFPLLVNLFSLSLGSCLGFLRNLCLFRLCCGISCFFRFLFLEVYKDMAHIKGLFMFQIPVFEKKNIPAVSVRILDHGSIAGLARLIKEPAGNFSAGNRRFGFADMLCCHLGIGCVLFISCHESVLAASLCQHSFCLLAGLSHSLFLCLGLSSFLGSGLFLRHGFRFSLCLSSFRTGFLSLILRNVRVDLAHEIIYRIVVGLVLFIIGLDLIIRNLDLAIDLLIIGACISRISKILFDLINLGILAKLCGHIICFLHAGTVCRIC